MWSPGAEILTVSQHAEVDRLSVLSGISITTLMENAGRQVANQIAKRWSRRKVTVLCGPGNNGGDGFVAARHLQARGWPVDVVRVGNHESASDAAKEAAASWSGPTRPFEAKEPIHGDLVVDAIFGAGLSRGLSPQLSQLFEDIDMADIPVVAVDVPSGIHGDRAKFLDETQPWSAALCVTFFRKKPAHVLYPARQHCGDIVCVDIGIGDGMIGALAQLPLQDAESLLRCDEVCPPFRLSALDPATHKFKRGHCLVVSGPAAMTGASRLAARAALRAGTGLVTVAGDDDALPVLAAHLTAIMVRRMSSAEPLSETLQDPRVTACVIGPGAGNSAVTRQNVLDVLAARRPVVIDADGISSFSSRPQDLFAGLHASAVLTPHEGEFERIFPGLLAQSANRIEAVRMAARRSGAVVLLKGPDTVVAEPQGGVGVNTNAPADLATAGSGDVLAGIIGGYLAQGVSAFDAAKLGAFLHGECGRLAGKGLIAEDLPDLLPKALESATDVLPHGL
jgi:NAD(P)H-hydrate epimerase